MFTRVYGFLLRRVTFYNLTRFIGITGGVQDFGAELRYWVEEIPRKFQHPLMSYNSSLRGYNGEVLWRFTATEEVALLSTILQGGGSGIYARFCWSTTRRFTQFGDLFRRFINVEESWEEVRCADSALRKEAYGAVSFCDTAILQRGCFVWGAYSTI